MARATKKAVSSAAKTMAAEAQRPYNQPKVPEGQEWRMKPAYLLHPNAGTLAFYPTHVKATIMVVGVQGEELKPYIIQSAEDLRKVKEDHPDVYAKWLRVSGCLLENRVEDVFMAVGRKANRPEWAWGQEATRNAEVGKRRQKTLAVREYHLNADAALSYSSHGSKKDKVPVQVNQLCDIIHGLESPVLEASLMGIVKKAAADGQLKTKQDPWRIFQYYRPQLISHGVLKLKAGR